MFKNGFTLIELSIVLVIIGLLVGGILVGKDLIHAAELRGDIAVVQKLDTSVNAFRMKYVCLPGDCINATQFFGSSAYNGNGNGTIDGEIAGSSYPGADITDTHFIGRELAFAMDDLARANLVDFPPFDANGATAITIQKMPKLKSASAGVYIRKRCVYLLPGYCGGTSGHYFRLGMTENGFGYADIVPEIYTPNDAYYIDNKLDDGKPASGKVYLGANVTSSYQQFYPINSTTDADVIGYSTGNLCLQGGNVANNTYALTTRSKVCGLFVGASF